MATRDASVSTQKGLVKSGSFRVGSFENMFLSFLNAVSCSLGLSRRVQPLRNLARLLVGQQYPKGQRRLTCFLPEKIVQFSVLC